MRGLGAVLCALALMAAACSSGDTNGQTQAQTEPQATESQATETSGGGGMAFKEVADGLDSPLGIASTPSEPDRLYIVEQPGLVRVLEDGKLLSEPFLDVQDQVVSGGEQGLLSLAFDPEYESTGLFYVDYTDTNGDTRVVEYHAGGSAPVRRRELLFVDQPYANHNGGQLAFGPDGRLYVGMGDGGSGGDPENRAQNLDEKLGKLLSLDADPDVREKDWTIEGYGLRNPWRFSFDRETGDLWIGDVGQGAWEEIDHTPSVEPGPRELRLGRLRGDARLRGQGSEPGWAPRHAGLRVQPRRRLLGDRRLRLPRRACAGRRRPLRLRRLLQRDGVELRSRGRQGS